MYPQYEITNTVVQVNYRYTPGKNNVYNPISWSNTSNSSYILGQAYERVFGGSSEITFLTNQGFVLDNVTATMEGGGTITVTKNQDGSYRVYTSKVTGRITMTEYLSSTEHSITVNKTGTGNVGLSGNVPSTIYHKAPFSKYIDERSNVAVVNSITVTMGGIDITSSAVGERRTVGSVSEIPLTIDSVTDDVVITIDSTATSTPVTYGTVTVSPDHGTASPASFSADGTSHTITITPASGYTTTGMTATTTNNDLTVSVSGNTITVTGTSSNNATINVTVPAESTPSGNTAVITVNPSYACDGVNESITIGQPWSHTFVLPEYYDNSSYPVTSGSGHTRTNTMRPAYTYVSDTITMAGGGTITRNGNTFSTQNVTGNITGEIVFTLDQDVIYGHFTHGTIGGDEQHVSESDPTQYINTKLTGKLGDKLRVTHIDSGYTLTGSTIRANRDPHFENGVWTSGAAQIDTDAVANNLSWNAATGEVTVVKPFFYTTDPNSGTNGEQEAYFQIVLKIDTANPPASIEGYKQFLSGSTQEDNAGISGTLVGVAYGQTYTSNTNEIKPYEGWILDTTKGTNGISVINKLTYQPMSFSVGAAGSGQEYTITVPNIVAPYLIGIHVKQDPNA